MLGHGASWDHAEMCHRAGMPREDERIDVCVDGQAGCWLAAQLTQLSPWRGWQRWGGSGHWTRPAFPASAWGDSPGEVALCMVPEQGDIPGTSPYMAAVIWVTV